MLRILGSPSLRAGSRYRPGVPTRRLPLPWPLDVPASVAAMTAKAVGRPYRGARSAVWTSVTPDGPVTLHLEGQWDTLVGEAWGAGAQWGLDQMARLVGFDDRPETFEPPPGLVARLHRRSPGLRLGATGRVFEALVPAILGQRVTSVEAKRGYRGLVRAYGEPAPGPFDVWLPPRPDALASATYADLHPLGIERTRAQTIIEAARRVRRLEEVVSMEPAAAGARLLGLRGVGRWTAAIVLGTALGDPDAVPVGDYHIPNLVAWALAGEPRADDARMLELLAPYAGNRRRVLVLLKSAGISAPKYGPKTAPRDFTRS